MIGLRGEKTHDKSRAMVIEIHDKSMVIGKPYMDAYLVFMEWYGKMSFQTDKELISLTEKGSALSKKVDCLHNIPKCSKEVRLALVAVLLAATPHST